MDKLMKMIYDKFDSQAQCATALNWHRQKLNRILLGESMPSLRDTQNLANVLDVPVEVIANIFLTNKSRK